MKKYFPLLALVCLTLACRLPMEISVATPTPLPAPIISLPTPTELPPTVAPMPSQTVPPKPTATAEEPFVNRIDIGLIALEDQGHTGMGIGCGDSLVMVNVNIAATKTPLRAAYEYLLSIKDERFGESGLYNALYQSELKVDSVSIQNGIADVYLSGNLKLGGTCDNPRIAAQLEQVAHQFASIDAVNIYINERPLQELLSQK